jgi:hypothetical protein
MQEDGKTEWREFSIRCPAWLADAIDRFAVEDHRSRTGEVIWMLEPIVRERLAKEQQQKGQP